jgi:hypothetical protein
MINMRLGQESGVFQAKFAAMDGQLAEADTRRWQGMSSDERYDLGYARLYDTIRDIDARTEMRERERARQEIAAELGITSVPRQVGFQAEVA